MNTFISGVWLNLEWGALDKLSHLGLNSTWVDYITDGYIPDNYLSSKLILVSSNLLDLLPVARRDLVHHT